MLSILLIYGALFLLVEGRSEGKGLKEWAVSIGIFLAASAYGLDLYFDTWILPNPGKIPDVLLPLARSFNDFFQIPFLQVR